MHGHIIRELKNQKDCEIHLLAHPFFSDVAFLFSSVTKTWIFNREACQRSFGEGHFNRRWPVLHVHRLLRELNKQNFDLIIDLSQTDTSRRWMTYLSARHKIGTCYDQTLTQKIFASENESIKRLHQTNRSPLHLIDVFKKSLGLSLNGLPHSEEPSKRDPHILLQTTTSDKKKGWPLKFWQALIEGLNQELPAYRISILTNPEQETEIRSSFEHRSPGTTILKTTLRETYDVLTRASLLITLDTSIKHLATWTDTPIIEIATGSSSPSETGAYQYDALIFKAFRPCYPCGHSEQCRHPQFFCHNDIPPEAVLGAALYRLKGILGPLITPFHKVEQDSHRQWTMKAMNFESRGVYERRDSI